MAQQYPSNARAPPPQSTNASLSPPARDARPRTPTSPMHGQRPSFSELRGVPPSPRAQRQPSFSATAFQELLNNPPLANKGGDEFAERDWKTVTVIEVTDSTQVRWVENGTSVEDATRLLISSGAPNVVLIRERAESRTAVSTFDYSDLNAYLLLVVGLGHPDEDHIQSFNELIRKGREGKPIKLEDIKELGRREEFLTLSHTATLGQAAEIFGSGTHRIIIVREGTTDVVGILTQLRLVRFLWENGRHFPAVHDLFPVSIKDLGFGIRPVRSINGDRPLTDALELMNNESITSLPVLDNQNNVVGNISHVDVRLLTKSTSLPLLQSSCIHFISVILSERGMNDGKDSFPVFYVNPSSTVAHTVAKLVATRSHRMWIVDPPNPSPGPSAPPTPSVHAPMHTPFGAGMTQPTPGPPYTSATGTAVTAGSLPGQHMSGRLSGVISLTDVLNVFARASGLSPQDPDEARRRRRRSSSSSMRVSMDSARSSSVDLTRSGSVSGKQAGSRR